MQLGNHTDRLLRLISSSPMQYKGHIFNIYKPHTLMEMKEYNVIKSSDMEYQENDTIRSCSGCLTFHCIRQFEVLSHRNEYFWIVESEHDIDKRCCLNCLGKTFPEGSLMEVASREAGNCTTEVTTSCLYNPGTLFSQD